MLGTRKCTLGLWLTMSWYLEVWFDTLMALERAPWTMIWHSGALYYFFKYKIKEEEKACLATISLDIK